MANSLNAAFKGLNPTVQVFDATQGSIRMARLPSRKLPAMSEEEQELASLHGEEAIHDRFRKLFMLISEQYLKSELKDASASPLRH